LAVADALRILLVREAVLEVRSIAEGFERRRPTSAERHLWQGIERSSEPVQKPVGVGHQVGAVSRGSDRRGDFRLDRLQLGKPVARGVRIGREREAVGEILQGRGRFEQLVRRIELGPQLRRLPGELPEAVSR
jgi:hypothetical protein